MQSTFECKLKLTEKEEKILEEMARVFSQVERKIFVGLYVKKEERNLFKRETLRKYGITSRHYNSILYNLQGRVEAQRENDLNRIKVLEGNIKATKDKIKKLNKKNEDLKIGERKKIKFQLHSKKRRLSSLEKRLEKAKKKAKAVVPRVCFGSRKLFKAQYYLTENGYKNHQEWLKEWKEKRHSQFFLMGSKDERTGNQSAVYNRDEKSLTIKLCQKAEEIAKEKHLEIKGIRFEYGEEKIHKALIEKKAISYRFVRRKNKEGKALWYIKASIEEKIEKIISKKENGAIGIDLNAKTIEIGHIKADGNPTGSERLKLEIKNKTSKQIEAQLSDSIDLIINEAVERKCPIVVEDLDFEKKKTTLREQATAYAVMLSAFCYGLFYKILERKAYRAGIEVIKVNPAYTSIIGYSKYALAYGLRVDAGAAVAIARRAFGYSEKLKTRARSPSLHKILMESFARAEGKHVWSSWSLVRKRLGPDRRKWPGRFPSKEDTGGEKSQLSSAGHIHSLSVNTRLPF